MRVLRIELRRSVTLGITALLIVMGLLTLFWGGFGAAGSGGWATMTYTLRSSLSLLWPLALGAGAWQARREGMAGLQELITTSPRSPSQRLAPVATALAIGVVSAYLLVLLVGTVQIWRSPADAYLTFTGAVAAVVGALSLVAAAWLGLSLGRLMPSAFTAPLVTVLGVAVVNLMSSFDGLIPGPAFSLLAPDVPMAVADHVELPLLLSGQQGLWMAGLAVTGFALTAALTRRGRALALLPAVAAAAITLPFLPVGKDPHDLSGAAETFAVYDRDLDAMAPVCTPDLPKVCVMRVHSGLLPEVVAPARKALKALATLPDTPTAATEVAESELDTVGAKLDRNTLAMTLYLDPSGHVSELSGLTAAMLEGAATGTAACPPSELSDEEAEQNYVAGDLVGAWLSRRVGVPSAGSPWPELFDPAWKTFTSLPPATQRRRVIDYRTSALKCEHTNLYSALIKEAS